MTRNPIRIGNCSGFNGDRRSAIREILDGDPVDVVVGDYLAEVTLAGMVSRVASGKGRAWSEEFLVQLDGSLADVLDRGIKLVVDAGAFDPAGLAGEVRKLAAELGRTANVAHVEGDNLLDRLDELTAAGETFPSLDTGEPLSAWGLKPSSANAYLGGWGIVEALRSGADVVICGRVTDASLVVGPAAWWHGWGPDDFDALAGAVVAGHVIECGPQATGGNFSGFAAVPGMLHPGFPIAEIAADGSCVITKHANAGGAVTTDTVKAQLLYEIQGPIYLNPDVTVDLRPVCVEAAGPDRVRVSGTKGLAPASTTKVAITAFAGYENSIEAYLCGLDIEAKAELVLAQTTLALADSGIEFHRIDRLGTAGVDPASLEEATVTLRIVGRSADADSLAPPRFFRAMASGILGSIPGFHCESHHLRFTRPSPVVEYWPGIVSIAALPHVAVLDDGTRVVPVEPSTRAAPPTVGADEAPPPVDAGPCLRRPLGRVAHARSGDKGGNSNVGIWVAPEAYEWLRSELSEVRFRQLFPESEGLRVTRHEFPNLSAVHFVVHGNLGTGASSNGRLDALGKSVGEYLRARHLDVPIAFLPEQYR
ncbi:MAG: acyclic terpene utilization AtuA family protein [Sporichthyaceae bacterium]